MILQIIFDNILNRKIPWPSVPSEMSYEAQDLINRLGFGFESWICVFSLYSSDLIMLKKSFNFFSTNAFSYRFLTHDPKQRLGANGSTEVVLHFLAFHFNGKAKLKTWKSIHITIISVAFLIKWGHLQVKAHAFFNGVNWDNLALQKVWIHSFHYIFMPQAMLLTVIFIC